MFTKQLKEELLEVLNHTHTVKETNKSEFTRRTSLKPVHRGATVLYTMGGESQGVIPVRNRSHNCPTSHCESMRREQGGNEAKGVTTSHTGSGPV